MGESSAFVNDVDYAIAPAVGAAIIAAWGAHLAWMLRMDCAFAVACAHVAVQSFLCTGLFITGHDAIHGLAARGRPRLNRALGATALFLYGGFRYDRVARAHAIHHARPASAFDPDFTLDKQEKFGRWLASFAFRYFGWREFARMHLHVALVWLIGGALWKAVVYLGLPAWISALQLFCFGVYLPHRTDRRRPFTTEHRARSASFPRWLSLATCYHFGYHHEHHEYPGAPWWTLPRIRWRAGARENTGLARPASRN